MAFSVKDIRYGSYVFFTVSALSFALGQIKKTLKFMLVYALLSLFIAGANHLPLFLKSMLLLLVLGARICMPIMLYGHVFLKTTEVNEMITGMYALHLPKSFVITFAVAMRFFPTVKEEISCIRDAMRLRGIEISPSALRKRPVMVFESFMLPLLVRSSTIADELSASSITRGLDNPAKRSAFTRLRPGWRDILFSLIFLLIFAGIFLLKIRAGGDSA